jgi:hypothetical protein
MSSRNRRTAPRVGFFREAVIHSRRQLIAKCAVLDISKSGARIALDQSVTLPVEFTLQMSKNGAVRRQCQLIWRNNNEIGVRFCEGAHRSFF